MLASEIPNALSGWGTLYCDTYVNGTFISTKSCNFTLTVPDSVVPSITNISYSESVAGIADQFGCYVRTKSKLDVAITAAGSQGSTITSYRTTIGGTAYTSNVFTTNALNTAGNNTLTVTVTDSRGRTATETRTIAVADYSSPSLTGLSAQRCNADGSAPQVDGTNVRVNLSGSVSSVNGQNTISCKLFYKLSHADAWTETATIVPVGYAVSTTHLLLSPTFDVLHSYDIMVRLTDYFGSVEQTVSIGTKQVLVDFYRDGNGIAFGKHVEHGNSFEIASDWEVRLMGERLVDLIYPVGSIYMSVNDVSPALWIGGVWERIEGRFLLAADADHGAGTEGGEAAHTLSVEEIPAHTHDMTWEIPTANWQMIAGYDVYGPNMSVTYKAARRTSSVSGGSAAHNNMPPYLAVYMWRRVS